jgi:hypothetical protein
MTAVDEAPGYKLQHSLGSGGSRLRGEVGEHRDLHRRLSDPSIPEISFIGA